ncbi:MAG: hypothetical protein M9955_13130 [Rhizobiaceae bacterium]|jgi:hypothetical protein|nr:hypothetical protein [Rhizobiaceae bacterium]
MGDGTRRILLAFALFMAVIPAANAQEDKFILEQFQKMGLPEPDLKALKQARQQRGLEAKVLLVMEVSKACPGYLTDDHRLMNVLATAGSNATPTMLMEINQNSKMRAASADEPKPIDCSNIFARFGHSGSELIDALVPVPTLLATADPAADSAR